MPPHIARLAGLGAFGATAGMLALFALFAFITRPTQYAGMDWTNRFLAWLGVGGVLLALILVHILLGRRLLQLARNERPAP